MLCRGGCGPLSRDKASLASQAGLTVFTAPWQAELFFLLRVSLGSKHLAQGAQPAHKHRLIHPHRPRLAEPEMHGQHTRHHAHSSAAVAHARAQIYAHGNVYCDTHIGMLGAAAHTEKDPVTYIRPSETCAL